MEAFVIKVLAVTLVIISLHLFISQASHAEIYRYQDNLGIWHFTDDRVKAGLNTEIDIVEQTINVFESDQGRNEIVVSIPEALCPADIARRSTYKVPRGSYYGKKGGKKLIKEGGKGSPVFWASNDYFVPVVLSMWFKTSSNVRSVPKLPLLAELKPHTKKKVAEFSVVNTAGGWNYRYQHRMVVGALNPKHDSRCYYLPPVPADRAYNISQAFNGSFSHTGAYSRYAVDIAMPVGTPVLAARDGVVFSRKTDFVLNGLSSDFKRKANVLRIYHGDGTMATYGHLEFRTMKFLEGEFVRAGQVIGRSGNTGYSTGPHLHFAVHANQNMKHKGIPFKFYTESGIKKPVKGQLLRGKAVVVTDIGEGLNGPK